MNQKFILFLVFYIIILWQGERGLLIVTGLRSLFFSCVLSLVGHEALCHTSGQFDNWHNAIDFPFNWCNN
jgi:hypothetical protein